MPCIERIPKVRVVLETGANIRRAFELRRIAAVSIYSVAAYIRKSSIRIWYGGAHIPYHKLPWIGAWREFGQ